MTNREAFTEAIARLRAELRRSTEGGGEAYRQRHLARGKLLPRERVEMLLDKGPTSWKSRRWPALEWKAKPPAQGLSAASDWSAAGSA